MADQFSRSRMLLGEAAMEKLSAARVAIFGIGGVGSYVAEALVRCGVGHFLLVDSDTVDVTNLNRQIHATHKTIGMSKTEVMAARMREINPEAEIFQLQEFYLPENHELFFASDFGSIDYVVDAIDKVPSKVDLIVEATKRQIPVISSMGTGNKLNPTQLEVADISKTSVCPLARVMRRELKRLGITELKVVYSKEEPLKPYTQVVEGQVGRMGATPPGSVSFVPSVAGLIIASEVVKDICGIS